MDLGCPCWWDMTLGNICACCEPGGTQCGYPMHNECQEIKKYGGCTGKSWALPLTHAAYTVCAS